MNTYVGSKMLEGKDWGPGKSILQMFQGLPQGERLPYFMLAIKATVANTSGGSVTVTPSQLAKLIATINMDAPRFHLRSTGRGLYNLSHKLHGRNLLNSGVTIADSASGTVTLYLPFDFNDTRAVDHHDCTQPTALLEGKSLSFLCSATGLLATGVTVTAATINTTLIFMPGNGTFVPSFLSVDFLDWTGQTVNMGAGTFTDAFIYDETGATLDTTEYASIKLLVDGQTLLDNLPVGQIIALYDYTSTLGSAVGAEEEDPAAMDYIPLISQPPGYKLSDAPSAGDNTTVIITGTANQSRFLIRKIVPTSVADDNNAASIMGVPQATKAPRAVQTANTNDLDGASAKVSYLSKILPKRYQAPGSQAKA